MHFIQSKKLITVFMLVACIFSVCACDRNNSSGQSTPEEKDTYASVCAQLEKTSMGNTEYSQTQIDELEARFTKMNLTAGFAKVNHFRSTSEYAYVIEFENATDAQIFFEKIGTANYDVKIFDSVIVYGKSDAIDTIK